MSIAEACPTTQDFLPPLSRIGKWVQSAYWNGLEYCLSDLPWVPKSTLDAGCGDGTYLAALGSFYRWSSLDAIEFDEKLLGAAQVCHPCRVQYKQIQSGDIFPYEDRQFDLVVSHAALNYIESQDLWLEELTRVAADAVLVSSLSDTAYPLIRLMSPSHSNLNGRQKPLQACSPLVIRKHFEAAGFKRVSHCAPFPFDIQLFQRVSD